MSELDHIQWFGKLLFFSTHFLINHISMSWNQVFSVIPFLHSKTSHKRLRHCRGLFGLSESVEMGSVHPRVCVHFSWLCPVKCGGWNLHTGFRRVCSSCWLNQEQTGEIKVDCHWILNITTHLISSDFLYQFKNFSQTLSESFYLCFHCLWQDVTKVRTMFF